MITFPQGFPEKYCESQIISDQLPDFEENCFEIYQSILTPFLQGEGDAPFQVFSIALQLANKLGSQQNLQQRLQNEQDPQKKSEIETELQLLLPEISELDKKFAEIPIPRPKLISQNKAEKHSFLKATKLFISTFVNKHSKALRRACLVIEVIGLIALSIILAVSFILSMANPATYVAYLSSILVLAVVATLVHGGGIDFMIDKINAVSAQVASAGWNKKSQYENTIHGVNWKPIVAHQI